MSALPRDPPPESQLADQGRSLEGARLAKRGVWRDGRRPHVLVHEPVVAPLNPAEELSNFQVAQLSRHPGHDARSKRARVVDALRYTLAEQDLDAALLELHGLVVPLDLRHGVVGQELDQPLLRLRQGSVTVQALVDLHGRHSLVGQFANLLPHFLQDVLTHAAV
jgi:hypothetical protein